jgi:hypothetical protein
LQAISLGIKLDPLTPGDISYRSGRCLHCPVPASGAVASAMMEVSGDDGGVR